MHNKTNSVHNQVLMLHRARSVALLAPHRCLAASTVACLLLILFPTGRAGSPLCPLIHGDPISLRVQALPLPLVRYNYFMAPVLRKTCLSFYGVINIQRKEDIRPFVQSAVFEEYL
jgi:hypothetical protein